MSEPVVQSGYMAACLTPSLSPFSLILCSDGEGDGEGADFVFEEFVRLRVAGMEEGNETEA